jgi:hypothetical protein
MGAETRIFVKVQRLAETWVEVSAVVLAEAKEKAAELPGVVTVLEAQYDKPEECDIE